MDAVWMDESGSFYPVNSGGTPYCAACAPMVEDRAIRSAMRERRREERRDIRHWLHKHGSFGDYVILSTPSYGTCAFHSYHQGYVEVDEAPRQSASVRTPDLEMPVATSASVATADEAVGQAPTQETPAPALSLSVMPPEEIDAPSPDLSDVKLVGVIKDQCQRESDGSWCFVVGLSADPPDQWKLFFELCGSNRARSPSSAVIAGPHVTIRCPPGELSNMIAELREDVSICNQLLELEAQPRDETQEVLAMLDEIDRELRAQP
jgi:hypothetical protein